MSDDSHATNTQLAVTFIGYAVIWMVVGALLHAYAVDIAGWVMGVLVTYIEFLAWLLGGA